VASLRGLRYVQGDQVNAGGVNLRGMPLAMEHEREPIGELDGLLIDLDARRVRYLVVEAAHTGQKHLLPIDATTLDADGHVLGRVSADDLASAQPFDPSSVGHYDDDAFMKLLFRPHAA
jgi:hypothetical protein